MYPPDPDKERVNLWFVVILLSLVSATALATTLIVVLADGDTDNLESILGVVLAAMTGIIGGVIGHHIGTHR